MVLLGHRGVASPGSTPSQHMFAQIPAAHIERSVFNRSSSVKTAFDSGYLVPIFADEALPGDTFSLKATSFARLSTPIFPVMDNIWMDFFFFSVPIRLLWQNWQKFNGEQANPGDSTSFLTPVFSAFTATEKSLSDYLGIPINTASPLQNVVSFWHRAYNLIWREWFRDENLQNSPVVDTGDGPDNIANYVLLRRGKRHDYFTSCLPFTQKGASVTLPLGTSAPLVATIQGDGGNPTWGGAGGIGFTGGPAALQGSVGTTPTSWSATALGTGSAAWGNPHLQLNAGAYADLSSATAATINAIRQAFQIQRLLERDARGGSRYTEIIRAHFGVVSPDQRLQRPEYLGGGSTRINVHPVARTVGTTGAPSQAPIANLGAFATAGVDGIGFHHSFVEHCVVIGLVNIRADLNYQQGLNRMFSRRSRYDYYWPAFAHLGEQAVLNKEIYAIGGAPGGQDDAVFGYQERYAEYRYKPSVITASMRSTSAAPLDTWHLALNFGSLPALNSTFIGDQPPMQRVLAVQAPAPEFFGDFWFDLHCARPMPTYSVPGMVDHF